jgi:alanine racemase
LINSQQTVDNIAEGAETIGYEFLTSLGNRYSRNYTGVTK